MSDGNDLIRLDELPAYLPGEVVPASSEHLRCYLPDMTLIEDDFVAGYSLVWAIKDSGEHHFQTSLTYKQRMLFVSTVYLGINHNFDGGPPLIWETMATSDGDWLDFMARYVTREAAMSAHRKILRWLIEAGCTITGSTDNYGMLEA
jgi:hypothetical protein